MADLTRVAQTVCVARKDALWIAGRSGGISVGNLVQAPHPLWFDLRQQVRSGRRIPGPSIPSVMQTGEYPPPADVAAQQSAFWPKRFQQKVAGDERVLKSPIVAISPYRSAQSLQIGIGLRPTAPDDFSLEFPHSDHEM